MKRLILALGALLAMAGGAQAQSLCNGLPSANTACLGPSSGGAGFPAFRSMVNADLPPAPADTIKCNPTGSSGSSVDCTVSQFLTFLQSANNAAPTWAWIDSNDTSAISLFGTPLVSYVVSRSANSGAGPNTFLGAITQDVANSTASPTGITAYGKLTGSAATVFPLFARGDLTVTNGAVQNEIDCNNTGATSPGTFPPNLAFPVSGAYCIGVQVVNIGAQTSHSAIRIAQTGSVSVAGWRAGLYADPNSIASFGVFIDATSTAGPTDSALLRNTGAGTNLIVQTMGTLAAQNSVFIVQDSSQNPHASIKQIGDFSGHAWTSSGVSVPALGTCTGLGTGGTCTLDTGSNDGTGTVTLSTGTGPTGIGNIPLTFASAVGGNNSGCQMTFVSGTSGWPSGSLAFISAQTTAAVTMSFSPGAALTASSTYKVNYFCPGH